MKKALQGLGNQIALDVDYWKKIIGEIIVVKHGRQPVPGEELLLGGSGGSQPCIAVQKCSGGPRRALSLGDLVMEAGQDDEQKGFEGITRTASLAQPLPRQESSISGASLASLDHDHTMQVVLAQHHKRHAPHGRVRPPTHAYTDGE